MRTKIHKGKTGSQDALRTHGLAGYCPAHLRKVSKHLSSEGTPLLKYMGLTCGALKTPSLSFARLCLESMSSGTPTEPRSLAAPREKHAYALKQLI